MAGRRWFLIGSSALAVAAAVSVAVAGFESANAGLTNARGGHTVGTVVRGGVSAATVHYFSLDASAFAPDGLRNPSDDYYNEWDTTSLSNQDTQRCFNAGVELPNGATIKSVTFYYTEGSAPMYVELNRQNLANQTSLVLASTETPTTTGSPFYTNTVIAVSVNNVVTTKDAYSFGACPSSSTDFSGATIAYTG
jgi:hypothetical protein